MALNSAAQAQARQAVIDTGGLINGHFVFADGDHATVKVEMDRLWDYPRQLELIVQLLAQADSLPPADVIIGVPSGGQLLAQAVAQRTGLTIALLERIPGGGNKDFRFVSPADEQLAAQAKSIRIYEDVVTTLSSIAGVVKLLDPTRQQVHSLAVWRRGQTKPEYRCGLSDHYLVEEPLPSFPPNHCPICHPR